MNLDVDYFDHIKTVRLIGMLGKGSAELPIRLWARAAKLHAKDGILTGYSTHEIESLVGWWGKPGEMVEAMCKVGFIDKKGSEYRIHDWKKIQGHLVVFEQRARAGARERWRRYRADAKALQQAMLKHGLSNAPSLPYQALPNRTNHFDNDISNDSTINPKEKETLRKLIEEMKSPRSRGFYLQAIRKLGVGIVDECLGEIRYRAKTMSISNPAAYLTTLLKERMAEEVKT